jgi:hypothetical protein
MIQNKEVALIGVQVMKGTMNDDQTTFLIPIDDKSVIFSSGWEKKRVAV